MNDANYSKLAAFGIKPEDVSERFARSSGPGGQHVNKASTAVTLVCRKKKLTVTAQDTRSQARNRELAWQRLIKTLAEQRSSKLAEQRAIAEKKRRASRKRPRAVQQRILDNKRRRSQIKQLRRKPM